MNLWVTYISNYKTLYTNNIFRREKAKAEKERNRAYQISANPPPLFSARHLSLVVLLISDTTCNCPPNSNTPHL